MKKILELYDSELGRACLLSIYMGALSILYSINSWLTVSESLPAVTFGEILVKRLVFCGVPFFATALFISRGNIEDRNTTSRFTVWTTFYGASLLLADCASNYPLAIQGLPAPFIRSQPASIFAILSSYFIVLPSKANLRALSWRLLVIVLAVDAPVLWWSAGLTVSLQSTSDLIVSIATGHVICSILSNKMSKTSHSPPSKYSL